MVALFLLFNYRDVLKGGIRWLGAEKFFQYKKFRWSNNFEDLITSRDLCVTILYFYFFYYISR